MNRRRLLCISALFVWLSVSCTTGPKRLEQIREVVTQNQDLTPFCNQGASGACALLGKERPPEKPVAIMQGVSSNTYARLTAMVPQKAQVSYFLKNKQKILLLNHESFSRSGSRYRVDHIYAFGLNTKDTYELYVLGPKGELWDRRQFRALDVNKKRPRIALVSCLNSDFTKIQRQMWKELLEQKPDLLVMMGDNVYTDLRTRTPSPDDIWDRYVETWNILSFFKAPVLVPTLATWDDHDYGAGDGDRTFAHKTETTDIFFSFFPQRKMADGFSRGPGVSAWASMFGVQLVLLDNRSFRSPKKLPPQEQTHLGFDQEVWLLGRLQIARTPVFLISGDQFFGGYHTFESYEGSHPDSFKKHMKEWFKVRSPLVFVSGDRHLTEILEVPAQRFGYQTFELTSSAMHARTYPDSFKKFPTPYRIAGQDGEYNYMIVELMDVSRQQIRLEAKAFGLGTKLFFQKTLAVKRP